MFDIVQLIHAVSRVVYISIVAMPPAQSAFGASCTILSGRLHEMINKNIKNDQVSRHATLCVCVCV